MTEFCVTAVRHQIDLALEFPRPWGFAEAGLLHSRLRKILHRARVERPVHDVVGAAVEILVWTNVARSIWLTGTP